MGRKFARKPDYYYSLLKLHQSVNNYLYSLDEVTQQYDETTPGAKDEFCNQLQSCFDNLVQIQNMIEKKIHLSVFSLDEKEELPSSYYKKWVPYEDLTIQSLKRVKNTYLYPNSKKDSYDTKSADPQSAWINYNLRNIKKPPTLF